MAISDNIYTARFELPEQIEKGRAETIKCPIYRDGSLVAPASGTVSVFNESNTAVIDEQAVTVSGNVAQYAIGSSVMDNENLGDGWQVKWTLSISSEDFVFKNDAALVITSLKPVVTDTDLFRRVPALDPSDSGAITSETDYQDYLDEAWIEIMHRIIGQGDRPWLIMNPSSLRNVHMYLTLYFIFDGLAARTPERLQEAMIYKDMYDQAWKDLKFEYDYDRDGFPEGQEKTPNYNIWLM